MSFTGWIPHHVWIYSCYIQECGDAYFLLLEMSPGSSSREILRNEKNRARGLNEPFFQDTTRHDEW